ncbi:MAG: hypothetical protein QXG91_01910 [Candidatus Aenigmatarchaeota archaeon]
MVEKKKPSRLYYLLPIIFGLLGGVAGYLLVEDKNKHFGRKLLIVGIARELIILIIVVRVFLVSFILGLRSL